MAEPQTSATAFSGTDARDSYLAQRSRAALVEAARAGNRDAFENLVAANLGSAFRTALAVLGNEADARDACQDVFLKAWRELPRLRDVDRFDAWLGRILVNSCRSVLRTRGRRTIREIPIDDPAAARVGARGGFEDRYGEIDELQRAFEQLSVRDRTLLALHYLEHRPLSDIAEMLGVPEGTVKSRLYEARRAFERALEVRKS